MTDYLEIFHRLLFAMLIGCAIGIDRNLRGKPTGMKTLGLVALGSALVTMAAMNFALGAEDHNRDAVSRAIQGVITGIGFLGAGVIIHEQRTEKVRGLTTAASIWVTAAVGIVCGAGWWQVALMATGLILILFVIGRPLEQFLHRQWMRKSDDERADISAREED
ncbi:MgtC/SapB family protein [Herbaspirillum seropedicae]|uniref:Protein srpB, putative n=1 Tax=Ricinus communis TaxID=3988 RepID=B9TCJ7_RICCO|nr:MgtC/SapB family protein [Herbaspirillum seropedicae]AON55141.1 Protein srpB, putative [Herbaspirillum seropedicae]EEF26417.1 Protein srpB, putative [Ricinus communis]QDD65215.1 MgtC/SapB family protein [Herbaspirillum seropedicae]